MHNINLKALLFPCTTWFKPVSPRGSWYFFAHMGKCGKGRERRNVNKYMEEQLMQVVCDYTYLLMLEVSRIEDYLEENGLDPSVHANDDGLRFPKRRKLMETREVFARRAVCAIENFDTKDYEEHLVSVSGVKRLDAQMFADSLKEDLKEIEARFKDALKEGGR